MLSVSSDKSRANSARRDMIIGPKHFGVTTLTFIGHVTIRLPIPHFLFVLHCDQAPISSPFGDIGP